VLGRRQALEHVVTDGLGAHPLDEGLDDAEVDVGFEQRETDLAQGGVNGAFRQPGFAAKRLEDVLEARAE
jgi:hypothetical protein